jgi:pimeloyl-ACP methyl ester carboxylesterase
VTNWMTGVCEANGINIHYLRTGGSKPSLVLLHGLTGRVSQTFGCSANTCDIDNQNVRRADLWQDGLGDYRRARTPFVSWSTTGRSASSTSIPAVARSEALRIKSLPTSRGLSDCHE